MSEARTSLRPDALPDPGSSLLKASQRLIEEASLRRDSIRRAPVIEYPGFPLTDSDLLLRGNREFVCAQVAAAFVLPGHLLTEAWVPFWWTTPVIHGKVR